MASPKLIIVRHAESEHHIQKLSGGWTDTPITALGHEQSERVAARLRREIDGPIRLYTSDLQRASQTAQHITDAFGVAATLDWRLREHNNGEAVGLTIEEMLTRFPQLPFPHPPDHRPFPGGETAREFATRVGEFLDELDFDAPALPILVTHGGTLRPLIGNWLSLAPEATAGIGFPSHVTAITVLGTGWHGLPEIERLNDVSHLEGMPGYARLGA
jgi:probable phosphoglycerate mutase